MPFVNQHRRICQGGWGGGSPPSFKLFGQNAKNSYNKETIFGQFFGCRPPQVGNFFGQTGRRPPKLDRPGTPMSINISRSAYLIWSENDGLKSKKKHLVINAGTQKVCLNIMQLIISRQTVNYE